MEMEMETEMRAACDVMVTAITDAGASSNDSAAR